IATSPIKSSLYLVTYAARRLLSFAMAELKLHFFQAMIPFMPVFTIPFAPLWIRACLSPLLFTLGGAGIWWGIRGLRLTMQLAHGISRSLTRRGVSMVLGALFYGGIFAAALGSAYFAVALAGPELLLSLLMESHSAQQPRSFGA